MTDAPGNYSVDWAEQMRKADFRKESAIRNMIMEVERDGIHFQLPEGGWVLDREYRGVLTGEQLRPPFPVTVVEYSFPLGAPDPYNRPLESRKRMVLAFDHEGYGNGGVTLVPTFYIEGYKQWSPPVIGWDFEYNDTEYGVTRNSAGIEAIMHPRVILPNTLKQIRARHGVSEDEYFRTAMLDHSDEIMSYLGMCKALSLRAVDTIEAAPDPKKQSVRKVLGKRPLHSYRVLTLTPGADLYPRSGGEVGRTHASPRAHMRRGHMRTMKKTGKQVWVNSCMINGDGMIVKDYKVGAMK